MFLDRNRTILIKFYATFGWRDLGAACDFSTDGTVTAPSPEVQETVTPDF
jgi:hypothetical protein